MARDPTASFPLNYMNRESPQLLVTKLDATNFPEWRDQILAFDADSIGIEPRTYPGYPGWPLLRAVPRHWPSLDRALVRRRSATMFSTELPSRGILSRLLCLAHGISADRARGPVPSAGGMQSLELYLVTFASSWLPPGAYHFDRAGNHLSQILPSTSRQEWVNCVPSLAAIEGGAMLFVLVGDYGRVEAKYGARGLRFLLIEAGHLAQNLCLLASSLGLSILPLGGFFESEITHRLTLPLTDQVLYLLLCGKPSRVRH